MIKKSTMLILSILALVLGLSACTVNLNLGEKESSIEEISNEEVNSQESVDETEDLAEEISKDETPTEEETTADDEVASSNLSLEDAKSLFAKTYPDAVIDIAKTEGDAYYIQGNEGSDICKMKILSHDGQVVMSKRITTNRGNNGR